MSNYESNKKVHLKVHTTLPKILLSMEKNNVLKTNILKLLVLGHQSVELLHRLAEI